MLTSTETVLSSTATSGLDSAVAASRHIQTMLMQSAAMEESSFLPHGYCYLWNKPLLLTHLLSDLLIGISYVAISLSLAFLVHRARKDIPFSLVFVAFGLFIVACGLTHFMEVWTLWHPSYWAAGAVKVVTAAASIATAAAMPFTIPKALLTVRDARLSREREIAHARAAALQEQNAMLEAQAIELEESVHMSEELTAALEESNRALVRAAAEAEAARVAAETASHVKSDFLAVMSHELRTPLNAIMGYEQLLEEGVSGPVNELQQRQLSRIKLSASHLLGLIDEVLTLSRLEAGAIEPESEPTSVLAMLEEACVLVKPAADAKGLAMRLKLPATDAVLVSDPLRVRQILVNLLTNAVKFTERGEVALGAETDSDHVVFTVADTGIGIPPESATRIFEPFWQAEATRTRTTGGVGLGLSVAHKLAIALGGTLELTSTSSMGSAFTLRLPLDRVGGA
ncbi:MAG: HAMP domain-containing sensor histidine kinase [Gemmatimonadota bacterium]